MKKGFTVLLMLVVSSSICEAQTNTNPTQKPKAVKAEAGALNNSASDTTKKVAPVAVQTPKSTDENDGSADNYGWGHRISFIVGGGASLIATNLYNDPVVNKTNNAVIIEKASRIKSNLTFGISYTPFVSNVIRTIKVKNSKTKKVEEIQVIEYYPRGISYALFLNPVNLSTLADKGLSTSIDLGFGLGYRAGPFSVLGTMEFFSVRQPRDYFISQFQNNTATYTVNNQVQTSFDINDNSVFISKPAVAFGLKFCYTFDIIKSFYKTSGEIAK